MREMVAEMLKAAQQHGEINSDLDLEATSRAVNAMLIAIGDSQLLPHLNRYFQVTDESMPIERVIQATVDLIMHSMAPQV